MIIERVCKKNLSFIIHLLHLCHYFDTTESFFFKCGCFIYFVYFEKCQISDEMCVILMRGQVITHRARLRFDRIFFELVRFCCFLPDSIQTCSCQRRRSCGCRWHTVPLHCRTASLPLSQQKDTFQSHPPCPDSTFICWLIGWPSLTCPPTAAEKPCNFSVGRQQWPGKVCLLWCFCHLC